MKRNNFNGAVRGILHEYGVKTEDELAAKLYAEGATIPCIHCGREVSIENIRFEDGNPVCYLHRGGGYRV